MNFQAASYDAPIAPSVGAVVDPLYTTESLSLSVMNVCECVYTCMEYECVCESVSVYYVRFVNASKCEPGQEKELEILESSCMT